MAKLDAPAHPDVVVSVLIRRISVIRGLCGTGKAILSDA